MCMNSVSPLLEAGATIAQGLSDNSVAKEQARGLRMEGASAYAAANVESGRVRDAGRAVEGSNKVALADSGVDMNSASALDIAMRNARDNELDALMTMHQGNLTKWSKDNQAKQVKYQGKMALINSGIKASSDMGKAAAKMFPQTFGAA